MPVQTTAKIIVGAPLAAAFDAAVSIDARDLIQKHGPLPAIIKVEGHDAPWSDVGQTRRHTLSDRSSVNEELTAFHPNDHFAYRVSAFTGPFAALAREAAGAWRFATDGPAASRIEWTYTFHPAGALATPLLWFVVKCFWPGYLKAALSRVKLRAESIHENRDL